MLVSETVTLLGVFRTYTIPNLNFHINVVLKVVPNIHDFHANRKVPQKLECRKNPAPVIKYINNTENKEITNLVR